MALTLLSTSIVKWNKISVVINSVSQQKYFSSEKSCLKMLIIYFVVILPIIVVNVGSLSNDNGRLGTAAPPGVGVHRVVSDGDVVPLVHPDTRVWTVVYNVAMNVDIVTRPGHNTSTKKLL